MVCSNCGNEIKGGQHFCTNCGAPVVVTADEPENTNETVTAQAVEVEAAPKTIAEAEAEAGAEANEAAGTGAETEKVKEKAGTEAQAETKSYTGESTATVCAAYSTEKSPEAIVASIPKEYKPVSIWKFFGFDVLFSIPIVGVIASLIFSLDVSKNVNITNFARARFLCTVLETIMLMFAVFAVMLSALR